MSENNKMRELADRLNDYAYKYYVLDAPTISDKEYDALYDELVSLEESTGVVLPDSPTVRVGGDLLEGFENYTHKSRLYSLAKCQSKEQLAAWADKLAADGKFPSLSVEYKYDGLTLNLTYNEGKLARATTRGNGIFGEDVTSQAKTIRTVPLSIDYQGEIEVQGECIMRLSELKRYNETHDAPLKNARNAAAGALRNLDSKVTAERRLDFMAYNVGYSPDRRFLTQKEIYDFLVENRFKAGEYIRFVNSSAEMIEAIDEIEGRRASLDYLIDGAVVKVNEISIREDMGYTAKAPRWAMAYKYEAEEASTIIKDVIWQVSRTGKINPLAVLESVELCGARVSRATLNNLDDIERKGVKIGSRVFVRRSNDVIPEILGVAEHYEHSEDIIPPAVCPSCGGEVIRDGVNAVCRNPLCGGVNISRIEHFASKEAMDIEGLSEKTVIQLYNLGFLKKADDLYRLTAEKLAQADGFKDKKINNLLRAIEKSKDVKLQNFVYALGIPNVGVKTAAVMAEHFGSFEKIANADKEELSALPDFGEIIADGIVNYFLDSGNKKLIESLFALGVKVKSYEVKSGTFSGLNVCLTGTLSIGRNQAKDIIRERGGKTADSISRAVNLVIAGDAAGSKLEKARKLGIKIINEQEFTDMLKQD